MTEPAEIEGSTDDAVWQRIAAIAAQRVLTRDGKPMRLRDIWGSTPVVHVFLRHFGCLFCHQMVADVLEASPRIAARGGHVVLVGCGTPEQAAKFARAKGIPREGVELFCDPGREAYDSAALERGWAKTFFDTGAHRAYAGARKEGHHITGVAGDIAQLGGVFVIAPPSRMLYEHRSRFAGDHPDADAIVEALRER
jgi:peroxiredoxin